MKLQFMECMQKSSLMLLEFSNEKQENRANLEANNVEESKQPPRSNVVTRSLSN